MKKTSFIAVALFFTLFLLFSCSSSNNDGDDHLCDFEQFNDDDFSEAPNPLHFNVKNTDLIVSVNEPIEFDRNKNNPVLRDITVKNPDLFSTNVVGVNMEGDVVPLIETYHGMLDVELTMPDPEGKYLYIALSDRNSPYLLGELDNCLFFRIPVDEEINDDNFECVSRHWRPVFFNANMGESLAGVRKQMHFDSSGNIFFLGIKNFVHNSENAILKLDLSENAEIPEGYPEDLISPLGKFVRITDSAQFTDDFLLTPSGVPVWTGSTQSGSGFFLKAGLREGGEVTLASSEIQFYATDTYDAILWGPAKSDECQGLRFARLSDEGGFTKRCFDSKRLSPLMFGVKIDRLMLANDGFYYGLYPNIESMLSLSRILPPSPEPIMSMDIKEKGLGALISQGGFQISHQHVFVIEEIDDPNYGLKDIIRAVRVDTREERLLFNSKRVEIYRFKISGDRMFVVGRDLSKMVSFVAEIDMAGLVQGLPEEDIVEEAETYNAALDSENIRELTVVRPEVPEKPTGVNPKLMDVVFDIDEPQTATLSFSVPVNEKSVENSYTLEDSEKNSVDTLGIWGYANLHLLFDDSEEGSPGEQLKWGEVYDFKLGGKAIDKWNNPISDKTAKLTPRDAFGFSIRQADMQPFDYPPTLRFVLNPELFHKWGVRDNLERYWLGKFDETIEHLVEGIEITADFRALLPQLTVFDYPDSAGFSFELNFNNWEECNDDTYPQDCFDFDFYCVKTEKILSLGASEQTTFVEYEASNLRDCATSMGQVQDKSWNQYSFRKINSKRYAETIVINEIFEDESVAEVFKDEKLNDTAGKREHPQFTITAGSTIEFKFLEVWPLDHDGNRLGDKPFLFFNEEVAENAPALWGEKLLEYLGVMHLD
ncbi:MAG: hypothetical protein ACOX2F_05295 [bacterium]